MFDIDNSYWAGKGKYQQEIEKLYEFMPDYGYTDNDYVNLFITISKVYYRHYNDGDSIFDFEDRIEDHVLPFENEIQFDKFKDYDGADLENLVDRVIEFIKDEDLTNTALEKISYS
jgi:hypothetical protein